MWVTYRVTRNVTTKATSMKNVGRTRTDTSSAPTAPAPRPRSTGRSLGHPDRAVRHDPADGPRRHGPMGPARRGARGAILQVLHGRRREETRHDLPAPPPSPDSSAAGSRALVGRRAAVVRRGRR